MTVQKRFLKVAIVFIGMVRDFSREYKLIRRKGYSYSQQKMSRIHEKRAKQLYDMAISLGGVLIKLCQFLSARRDVFPEPYIRILSSLQDDVPPVEFTEIEKVLEREYGVWKRYFKAIEPMPIASASLGQVHKGILHDGKEVVLKILKPEVEKVIDIDFAILFYVFKLLSNFKPFRQRADLHNLLEEFITVTGDELNFKREAHVAIQFRKYLKRLEYVSVPYIYLQYCTKKIIVMEFLSGDKINDIDIWIKRNNNPKILSRRVIELYFEQFLFMKLIHFDPHPGNILVRDNNNLVLLDFGMSGEITERMRKDIRNLLAAVINRDYRKILDGFDSLGFIRKGVNKYLLLPVIEYFFGELLGALKLNRESIHTADLSPIIDNLIEIIYNQPFNLPAHWAFIGKTIGTLSGFVATLNPDFNIYDELVPYADKLFKDSFRSTVDKTLSDIKANISSLYALPARANSFIENIERGHYKFHIDSTDINDKIDKSMIFIIRFFSFIISLFSGVGSFIFYNANKNNISFLLLLVAGSFLVIALAYRGRSLKERIKSKIQ